MSLRDALSFPTFPALKRWAIVGRPSAAKSRQASAALDAAFENLLRQITFGRIGNDGDDSFART